MDGEDMATVVTCTYQSAGTQIGDEFRYDVNISGFEIEFCVIIDEVL